MVFAQKESKLTREIKRLVEENSTEIIGYKNGEAVKMKADEICLFTVENNKVYAKTKKDTFAVKQRLYVLEEILGEDFIKINQSCLAKVSAIKKFNASISCSVQVVFEGGYVDYVSRRNIKKVKERFGV